MGKLHSLETGQKQLNSKSDNITETIGGIEARLANADKGLQDHEGRKVAERGLRQGRGLHAQLATPPTQIEHRDRWNPGERKTGETREDLFTYVFSTGRVVEISMTKELQTPSTEARTYSENQFASAHHWKGGVKDDKTGPVSQITEADNDSISLLD